MHVHVHVACACIGRACIHSEYKSLSTKRGSKYICASFIYRRAGIYIGHLDENELAVERTVEGEDLRRPVPPLLVSIR